MLRLIRVKSQRSLIRLWHYIPNKNAVVIAAAVRTPAPIGQSASAFDVQEPKLAGLVIDELVKRTLVPRDEFEKLIICSSSQCSSELTAGMAKDLGLKSCQTYALQEDTFSAGALQMTLESLQHGEAHCIITGDSRCQGLKLPTEGVLASELMTQPVAKRKKVDDKDNIVPSAVGAAALAWTTFETAQRLQLQPLALVREFLIEENLDQALYRLSGRRPIEPNEVHNWQMVTVSEKDEHLKKGKRLIIPDAILANLPKDQICIHDAKQITASHLLTHLVHSLPTGSLGCAVMDALDGRHMVLIIEKLSPNVQSDLPKLTLYTKEPCPLCDDLVARLEEKFAGQFHLEKVFIDQKENVRFLRLFRHDIPVLFLNGQFLCMHRLNEEVLTERLAALKNAMPTPQNTKET